MLVNYSKFKNSLMNKEKERLVELIIHLCEVHHDFKDVECVNDVSELWDSKPEFNFEVFKNLKEEK